jgi:hypothetical protein
MIASSHLDVVVSFLADVIVFRVHRGTSASHLSVCAFEASRGSLGSSRNM